jgi:hypothetical protein
MKFDYIEYRTLYYILDDVRYEQYYPSIALAKHEDFRQLSVVFYLKLHTKRYEKFNFRGYESYCPRFFG